MAQNVLLTVPTITVVVVCARMCVWVCMWGGGGECRKGMKPPEETVSVQSLGPRCGGAQGLPVVLPLNSPMLGPPREPVLATFKKCLE